MKGEVPVAAGSPAITSSPRYVPCSGLFVLSGLDTKGGAF